jgi:hypothetical protein
MRINCWIIIFCLALTACSAAPNQSSGGVALNQSTPTPTPTPTPPPVSTAAPLALKIFTTYDTTSYNDPQTFVETGTTLCQATTATPNVTCTVTIPEGRLFFSSLSFQFSWLPSSNCKLLLFQPYFYQISTSSSFQPLTPGLPIPSPAPAPLNCSQGSASPAGCFGGAAASMVPNFPTSTGVLYQPNEADLTVPNTVTSKLNSTNSSSYNRGLNSLRMVVNDLSPADIAGAGFLAQIITNPFPGTMGPSGFELEGYAGGSSWSNYVFSCRDDYFDPTPYQITVFVKKKNSVTGASTVEEDFASWDIIP